MSAISDFFEHVIGEAEADVAVIVTDVKKAFTAVETSAYAIVKTEARTLLAAGRADLADIEQAIIQKYEAEGGFPGLISRYGSAVLQAIIAVVKAGL